MVVMRICLLFWVETPLVIHGPLLKQYEDDLTRISFVGYLDFEL